MGTLFRGLIKLVVIASAASIVLAVLLIGICAALLTALWSLLTGRKPAAYTTFMRFRDASRQFKAGNWQSGNWPGRAAPAAASNPDIVDVQAHEVRSAISDQR